MVIVFDGERFEASLLDTSVSTVAFVMAPHMAGKQPVHPPTEITI